MSEPYRDRGSTEIDAGVRGVVLRELTLVDADRYWKLVQQDPESFYRVGEPTAARYQTVEDVEASFIRDDGTNRFGVWVDGAMVGYARYKPSQEEGYVVELGYWIGKEYEGRGFMSAAVRTLVPFIADQGWRAVEAWVRQDNERSRYVLERTGFSDLGVDESYETTEVRRPDGTLVESAPYLKYRLEL